MASILVGALGVAFLLFQPAQTYAAADGPRSTNPIPPDLTVAKPSSSEPVTAAIKVTPAQVKPGESFEVLVLARIAGGHHIYATNAVSKTFIPTGVKLGLPKGIETSGDWITSAPTLTKTGETIFTDVVWFRRECKVGSNNPPTRLSIDAELRFQACTDELCWPPGKIKLSAAINLISENQSKP